MDAGDGDGDGEGTGRRETAPPIPSRPPVPKRPLTHTAPLPLPLSPQHSHAHSHSRSSDSPSPSPSPSHSATTPHTPHTPHGPSQHKRNSIDSQASSLSRASLSSARSARSHRSSHSARSHRSSRSHSSPRSPHSPRSPSGPALPSSLPPATPASTSTGGAPSASWSSENEITIRPADAARLRLEAARIVGGDRAAAVERLLQSAGYAGIEGAWEGLEQVQQDLDASTRSVAWESPPIHGLDEDGPPPGAFPSSMTAPREWDVPPSSSTLRSEDTTVATHPAAPSDPPSVIFPVVRPPPRPRSLPLQDMFVSPDPVESDSEARVAQVDTGSGMPTNTPDLIRTPFPLRPTSTPAGPASATAAATASTTSLTSLLSHPSLSSSSASAQLTSSTLTAGSSGTDPSSSSAGTTTAGGVGGFAGSRTVTRTGTAQYVGAAGVYGGVLADVPAVEMVHDAGPPPEETEVTLLHSPVASRPTTPLDPPRASLAAAAASISVEARNGATQGTGDTVIRRPSTAPGLPREWTLGGDAAGGVEAGTGEQRPRSAGVATSPTGLTPLATPVRSGAGTGTGAGVGAGPQHHHPNHPHHTHHSHHHHHHHAAPPAGLVTSSPTLHHPDPLRHDRRPVHLSLHLPGSASGGPPSATPPASPRTHRASGGSGADSPARRTPGPLAGLAGHAGRGGVHRPTPDDGIAKVLGIVVPMDVGGPAQGGHHYHAQHPRSPSVGGRGVSLLSSSFARDGGVLGSVGAHGPGVLGHARSASGSVSVVPATFRPPIDRRPS
ncbi:hypothetical protein M427DRAFT_67881, partial [Gonapodya prolifera JEL478]